MVKAFVVCVVKPTPIVVKNTAVVVLFVALVASVIDTRNPGITPLVSPKMMVMATTWSPNKRTLIWARVPKGPFVPRRAPTTPLRPILPKTQRKKLLKP